MKKQTKLAAIIAMGIAGILFSACSKEPKESGPKNYQDIIDLTVLNLDFNETHRTIYSENKNFVLHICPDNNHHKQTKTKNNSETVQIYPYTGENFENQRPGFGFNGDILWVTTADGKPVERPDEVSIWFWWNGIILQNGKREEAKIEINDDSFKMDEWDVNNCVGYAWVGSIDNKFYIGSDDYIVLEKIIFTDDKF